MSIPRFRLALVLACFLAASCGHNRSIVVADGETVEGDITNAEAIDESAS